MTELNVPLLRKVMEYIDEHPEDWEQGSWATHVPVRVDRLESLDAQGVLRWPKEQFTEEVELFDHRYACKTAYCFAGHAAVMSGATFKKINVITWNGELVTTPEGKTMHVRSYAKKILGLTDTQASALFFGGHSRRSLRRLVNELIETGDIKEGQRL